jgi:hypothetical protein
VKANSCLSLNRIPLFTSTPITWRSLIRLWNTLIDKNHRDNFAAHCSRT